MRISNRDAGADHDRILRFRNANVAQNSAFGLIHSHLAVKENEDVLVIKHLVTTRCRPRRSRPWGCPEHRRWHRHSLAEPPPRRTARQTGQAAPARRGM